MSDLPRVYVNPIEKDIDNVQSIFSSKDRNYSKVSRKNLSMKIKDIFSSNNYVYKRRVRITTKDYVLEKNVVGKANGYLITIEGEKIKISDIYDVDII